MAARKKKRAYVPKNPNMRRQLEKVAKPRTKKKAKKKSKVFIWPK